MSINSFVSKRPPQSRLFYKSFIISFLVGLILVPLVFTIFLYREAEIEWDKQDPAYDVKNEYIAMNIFGALRTSSLKSAIPGHQSLASLFEYIQKQAYDSAIQKIPDMDGERVIWDNLYYIAPKAIPEDPENVTSTMLEMTGLLDKLSSSSIANKRMREIAQYEIVANYLTFFAKNQQKLSLAQQTKNQLRSKLAYRGYEALRSLKPKDFFNTQNPPDTLTPLRLADIVFILFYQDIFYSGNFECDEKEIAAIQYVSNYLYDALPQYKKAEFIGDYELLVQRIEKVFSAKMPVIQAILIKKCRYTMQPAHILPD